MTQHTCSDCGQPMHQQSETIGECTNPHCRLYYVTLTYDALDALTEPERVEWGRITAKFRAMELEEQARSTERMSRIPERLRRLG